MPNGYKRQNHQNRLTAVPGERVREDLPKRHSSPGRDNQTRHLPSLQKQGPALSPGFVLVLRGDGQMEFIPLGVLQKSQGLAENSFRVTKSFPGGDRDYFRTTSAQDRI